MRILIIGAGAVGSFIGARLALAGYEVTLVGRPALVAAVRSEGMALIEPAGTRQIAQVAAVPSIPAAFSGLNSDLTPTATTPYDLALLTVKAYDTAATIAEIQASGAQLPPLVTLQNGVGNEEALAEAFGAQQVVAGAIDTPVSVSAVGQVQIHRARFRAAWHP